MDNPRGINANKKRKAYNNKIAMAFSSFIEVKYDEQEHIPYPINQDFIF